MKLSNIQFSQAYRVCRFAHVIQGDSYVEVS
jgi:hypothetical protein